MKFYIKIVFAILFTLTAYLAYAQVGICIKEELLQKSFENLQGQDEKTKSSIDPVLREKIYSKEMISSLLAIISKIGSSLPCDSIQQINLIYCYQQEHWNEYVYISILDLSGKNHYFLYESSSSYVEKIGITEGKDYLLSVANQLFRLESPSYNDFMIVATIQEDDFTSYKATQQFSILRHFQIIAAVEQLIRYSNQ